MSHTARPLVRAVGRAARRRSSRSARRARRDRPAVCRPVVLLPPAASRDVVVPMLVDVSRSMRVADADGQTRIARAAALLERELLPALSRQYAHGDPDASATRSSAGPVGLAGRARRPKRYQRARSRACASAIADGASRAIVLCRMAATPGRREPRSGRATPPAPGRCSRSASDRPTGCAIARCSASTAGDPRLDQASVDLHVSAVEQRLRPRAVSTARARQRPAARQPPRRAGGRRVADRRALHRVRPIRCTPTVYTAEIAADRRRTDRREQHAQRARQPGRTQAPAAGASRERPGSSTAS